MTHLLDTQVLLWAAAGSSRLSAKARDLIEDETHELVFSAASIWEVAIKTALGRPGFLVDPAELRSELLANGYVELPVSGGHAAALSRLPPHHKDPFDRMLLTQAIEERLTLVTADEVLAAYQGPVIKV